MAGGVEFLAGPDPDGDTEPDHHEPARHSRALVWVAAAALVVVAVTWAVTRPTGAGRPASQPVSQPSESVRTVTASATPPPTRTPVTTQRICSVGAPVNAQLLLIAQRNLRGATLLADQSYRCTSGTAQQHRTVSVSIAMRYRTLIIEIQATRRVGDSGQYLPAPAQADLVSLVSAESQSAGLNVLVEAFGRPRTKVDDVVLSELASDVSLQLVL